MSEVRWTDVHDKLIASQAAKDILDILEGLREDYVYDAAYAHSPDLGRKYVIAAKLVDELIAQMRGVENDDT